MDRPPSTPIEEALKDCTAAERKAIAEKQPPYDGVRTWGDLLAVRVTQKNVVQLNSGLTPEQAQPIEQAAKGL